MPSRTPTHRGLHTLQFSLICPFYVFLNITIFNLEISILGLMITSGSRSYNTSEIDINTTSTRPSAASIRPKTSEAPLRHSSIQQTQTRRSHHPTTSLPRNNTQHPSISKDQTQTPSTKQPTEVYSMNSHNERTSTSWLESKPNTSNTRQTQTSSVETDMYKTQTLTSSTETDMYKTQTSFRETDMYETQTQTSSTETDMHETQTQTSSTETDMHDTQTQTSSTETDMHETQTQTSSTERDMYETQTQTSSTERDMYETQTQTSSTERDMYETQTQTTQQTKTNVSLTVEYPPHTDTKQITVSSHTHRALPTLMMPETEARQTQRSKSTIPQTQTVVTSQTLRHLTDKPVVSKSAGYTVTYLATEGMCHSIGLLYVLLTINNA